MNGQLAIIQTLIDDYKVDPNSKSEVSLLLMAQDEMHSCYICDLSHSRTFYHPFC